MPIDPLRIKALFHAALDLQEPSDRSAFLDVACAGDVELRARLDDLLAAAARPASALGRPLATAETVAAGDAGWEAARVPGEAAPIPPGPASPSDDLGGWACSFLPPLSPIGTTISGRYKVREEIGAGGMGTVYLAEQVAPVKRLVALKLIRAGMDSRQVLARFEAERQALAVMDHPHIARVLDAGTTESGHPFFVMELVRGVPITGYCDHHRLGIRERLQLFRQVCAAVQHAHQKGIIHRDLKPSNILVEDHDGTPVPKVIDFGLAKAITGLQLTEHTLFTAFGVVAGTPLYMAPEQATFGAVDVDTRADIFALGVIFYELLTGSTPIRQESLRRGALDEILRIVREDEPPVPSHRIGTSEGLPSLAANRQVEPKRLSRFVRGDLDWIAMKALAKERSRRYDSAIGLANDVERFLMDEPVSAGPPTASYRASKFLRRNRGRALSAVLLLVVLCGGAVGTLYGLYKARMEEINAELKRLEAERQTDKYVATVKAIGELARFYGRKMRIGSSLVDRPIQEDANWSVDYRLILELLDRIAFGELENAIKPRPNKSAKILRILGNAYVDIFAEEKGLALLLKATDTFEANGPEEDFGVYEWTKPLTYSDEIAEAYYRAREYDKAIAIYEDNYKICREHEVEKGKYDLQSRIKLANALFRREDYDRAFGLFEFVLSKFEAYPNFDRFHLTRYIEELAGAYHIAGRPARSIELYREAADYWKQNGGEKFLEFNRINI